MDSQPPAIGNDKDIEALTPDEFERRLLAGLTAGNAIISAQTREAAGNAIKEHSGNLAYPEAAQYKSTTEYYKAIRDFYDAGLAMVMRGIPEHVEMREGMSDSDFMATVRPWLEKIDWATVDKNDTLIPTNRSRATAFKAILPPESRLNNGTFMRTFRTPKGIPLVGFQPVPVSATWAATGLIGAMPLLAAMIQRKDNKLEYTARDRVIESVGMYRYQQVLLDHLTKGRFGSRMREILRNYQGLELNEAQKILNTDKTLSRFAELLDNVMPEPALNWNEEKLRNSFHMMLLNLNLAHLWALSAGNDETTEAQIGAFEFVGRFIKEKMQGGGTR